MNCSLFTLYFAIIVIANYYIVFFLAKVRLAHQTMNNSKGFIKSVGVLIGIECQRAT